MPLLTSISSTASPVTGAVNSSATVNFAFVGNDTVRSAALMSTVTARGVTAVSFSTIVTATSAATAPYPLTAWLTVTTASTSASASSAARTVTSCGSLQLSAVNVRIPGLTATSVPVATAAVTVTVPSGRVASTTG